jgi:hypothetical protein
MSTIDSENISKPATEVQPKVGANPPRRAANRPQAILAPVPEDSYLTMGINGSHLDITSAQQGHQGARGCDRASLAELRLWHQAKRTIVPIS